MIVKALISGLLVAVASEVASRSPTLGGLIMSLPLISVSTFVWLWRDTGDHERVAQLSDSIFWFFLPTLPMFVIFPLLLRNGVGFPVSLSLALLLTAGLYVGMLWLAPQMDLRLSGAPAV